jgi:hypothetical protein
MNEDKTQAGQTVPLNSLVRPNIRETKHTPGPWKATKDPDSIRGEDYCIGMETDVARIDRVAVCSECDASLIAAAPELLEAVDRLLAWSHGGQRTEDVAFARRAYAKALGLDG